MAVENNKVTLESLSAQVQAIDQKLTSHLVDEANTLASAFPGGDASGHRRAHEAMIEATNAQRKFWDDLRLDLAKKGAWAIIIVVLGLLAMGVVQRVGLSAFRP